MASRKRYRQYLEFVKDRLEKNTQIFRSPHTQEGYSWTPIRNLTAITSLYDPDDLSGSKSRMRQLVGKQEVIWQDYVYKIA